MRSGRGRGVGGKSTRILDLIDHYWDQIEGDFAQYLNGTDARAWVRGERDWDQFLTYCTTVAQIDGSQLRAAQLNDPRYDAQMAAAIDNAPANPRPPLVGETAELRELRGVRNDIRALLRAKGMQVPFLQGPEMPSDRLQRKRKREVFDFFRNLVPKKERGD